MVPGVVKLVMVVEGGADMLSNIKSLGDTVWMLVETDAGVCWLRDANRASDSCRSTSPMLSNETIGDASGLMTPKFAGKSNNPGDKSRSGRVSHATGDLANGVSVPSTKDCEG